MNASLQYIGSGLILGSLFALVLLGKMDPSLYANIAIGALTGLGVYHASGAATGTGSSTTPPPPASSAKP